MITALLHRHRPFLLFLALVATIGLANQCVSRGYVTDGDRQPLRGADVWFANSVRVVHRLRTDSAGFFWVVHAPFARRHYSRLICEGRRRMLVDSAPTSAIIRSEYGIGAYSGQFPDTPSDRGWTVEAPQSCPARDHAHAG